MGIWASPTIADIIGTVVIFDGWVVLIEMVMQIASAAATF